MVPLIGVLSKAIFAESENVSVDRCQLLRFIDELNRDRTDASKKIVEGGVD